MFTFLGIRHSKEIITTIEYLSGNFITHKHNQNIINLVICYKKNKELSIPVLELYNNLKEDNHEELPIQIID